MQDYRENLRKVLENGLSQLDKGDGWNVLVEVESQLRMLSESKNLSECRDCGCKWGEIKFEDDGLCELCLDSGDEPLRISEWKNIGSQVKELVKSLQN